MLDTFNDRRGLFVSAGDGLGNENFFYLGVRLFLGLAGRNITSLGGIDPDFLDAAVDDAADVLGILEHKGATPKRVLHPRATKLLKEHAGNEVFDCNSFQHGKTITAGTCTNFISGKFFACNSNHDADDAFIAATP